MKFMVDFFGNQSTSMELRQKHGVQDLMDNGKAVLGTPSVQDSEDSYLRIFLKLFISTLAGTSGWHRWYQRTDHQLEQGSTISALEVCQNIPFEAIKLLP